MKSKKKFSLFFIGSILLYGLSFIATSKQYIIDNPCDFAIINRINNDSSINNHIAIFKHANDTIIINGDTTRPGNWDRITDTLCSLFKRNCNATKSMLLVNFRDTARINWNTPYGKKIFFKVCP